MKKAALLLIYLLTWAFQSYAQEGSITNCIPSSALAGQVMDVVIRGKNTNFVQNTVIVSFDNDIQVLRTEIKDFETILCKISIPAQTPPGSVSIQVHVGNESLILNGGFSVLPANGNLTAVLEIYPAQNIRISDFELKTIRQAPIICNFIVYNDNVKRDILVKFTLTGDRYGLLATSEKQIKSLNPSTVFRFTNRDFDKYTINAENNQLIQAIMQSNNSLPADVYEYKIELFDEKGVKIGEATSSQIISNLSTRPELILPGTPFSQTIIEVSVKYPQFQWFSQSSSFDFALYPVLPSQTTQEEVLLNRPVYQVSGLKTNSLVYPASAEILQEGQLYAWQIKAHYTDARGDNLLPSDVFWFRLKKESPDLNVEGIRISPSYVEIKSGDKISFKIEAQLNNEIQSLTPNTNSGVKIRLSAPSKGQILSDGSFVAGNSSCTLAYIVEYAGYTEYATLVIRDANSSKPAISGVLDMLFGLPPAAKPASK